MILEQDTYVEKAEQVIKELNEKNRFQHIPLITTSKIRNLLSMTADIYNEVCLGGEKLSDELRGRINYLKIRFIYEAGRDKNKSVKYFVDQAEIIKCIEEIKDKKKQYILFSRYMEALVAYHRYYGGKD